MHRVIIGLLDFYPETLIEGTPSLNHRECGCTVHRYRELIKKSTLSEQHRPRCTPMLQEPNLGLPFDEMIIVSQRMEQANPYVHEIYKKILAANT
jgi:hypothetical protein